MASGHDTVSVRLAELVATLSLATDLGRGQPMEHTIRQTVIALRLADRLGVGEDDRIAIYYTGLLVSVVYCHADAHEQALWFGDDIALKANTYKADMESLRDVVEIGFGSGLNVPFYPEVRRWQHRLEPLQKRIFGGCHVTRRVVQLLNGAGFEIVEVDVFYEDGSPKFLGADALGVARAI